MKNQNDQRSFMAQAIALASENVANGGKPFGTVITKGDVVIATGVNSVHDSHDPSDHAEIQAVRCACKALGSANLAGCDVYVVGLPCPMCLCCLILAGPDKIVYALDTERKDKALDQLPLTKDLYEKLAFPLKKTGIEMVYDQSYADRAEMLFRKRNNSQT